MKKLFLLLMTGVFVVPFTVATLTMAQDAGKADKKAAKTEKKEKKASKKADKGAKKADKKAEKKS